MIVDIQGPAGSERQPHDRDPSSRWKRSSAPNPPSRTSWRSRASPSRATAPSTALAFVTLKDLGGPRPGNTVQEIANRVNGQLFALKDATTFALRRHRSKASAPPGGFSFRLQDRGGKGKVALSKQPAS